MGERERGDSELERRWRDDGDVRRGPAACPTAAAKSIERSSPRTTDDEHRVRMLLSAARGCQWRQRNRSGEEERVPKQIFVSEQAHKKDEQKNSTNVY